jgi:hypothetical protein
MENLFLNSENIKMKKKKTSLNYSMINLIEIKNKNNLHFKFLKALNNHKINIFLY